MVDLRKGADGLRALVGRICAKRKVECADVSFTRREVRDFTGWGDTQLKVHLSRLVELEYVLTHRAEARLPRHMLSAGEAERVLGVPDVSGILGLRDRAMLETLYSTGMRRMELIGLRPCDLDAERGTVMMRQGKVKRDRMSPMGERALAK